MKLMIHRGMGAKCIDWLICKHGAFLVSINGDLFSKAPAGIPIRTLCGVYIYCDAKIGKRIGPFIYTG